MISFSSIPQVRSHLQKFVKEWKERFQQNQVVEGRILRSVWVIFLAPNPDFSTALIRRPRG